ncbi:hypothetical protein HBB16_12290 [Pseudonocardia sp. MCCB 268]|nr:hypothetical protein [Pseudonocardia cytotoxica]
MVFFRIPEISGRSRGRGPAETSPNRSYSCSGRFSVRSRHAAGPLRLVVGIISAFAAGVPLIATPPSCTRPASAAVTPRYSVLFVSVFAGAGAPG